MDVVRQRNEDWLLNKIDLDDLSVLNERKFNSKKYIRLSSRNLASLKDKIKLLTNSNISLCGKEIVIEIEQGFYLTEDQLKDIEGVRTQLKDLGTNLKVKDGNFWELEEVSAASSRLDTIVSQINSATVQENGKTRTLNELEKFLWAYSYVANRKYQQNLEDTDSPRSITSILTKGDCVCVGFSTILKELCDKIGIECYRNSCNVKDASGKEFGHSNNVIVINGSAFYCDSCWDCLSDRRPRRTFANCLVPFQDRKDMVKDTTAPFCDMELDLKEISALRTHLESLETFDKQSYIHLSEMSKRISNYIPLCENQIDESSQQKTGYKQCAINLCNNAIGMINEKSVKSPVKIEDFEKALTNIYIASGNSREKAQHKTQLDIDASIKECAYAYAPTATNCFAQEYYKSLEV